MKKIAYQGVEGSYSHQACNNLYPKAKKIGFATFTEAIESVEENKVDIAVIPVENSTAGRVASSYFLIGQSKLFVIGEYNLAIEHTLIGIPGAKLSDIKFVYSHPQALAQSSKFITKNKLKEVPFSDTAFAVRYILEKNKKENGAIASKLSAELYGGKVIKNLINNTKTNKTRFLILSRKKINCTKQGCKKAIFFETKNIPAALFKCLSAFATEKINITKLESFTPSFKNTAQFYLEYEKPEDKQSEKRVLQELAFFSSFVKDLGDFYVL